MTLRYYRYTNNTFLRDCKYMYICLCMGLFIMPSSIWFDLSRDTLSVTWYTQNEAGAIPLTLIGCVVYLSTTVIGHSISTNEALYETHHYEFKMNFALRKVVPIHFEIVSSSRGSSRYNKHLHTWFEHLWICNVFMTSLSRYCKL